MKIQQLKAVLDAVSAAAKFDAGKIGIMEFNNALLAAEVLCDDYEGPLAKPQAQRETPTPPPTDFTELIAMLRDISQRVAAIADNPTENQQINCLTQANRINVAINALQGTMPMPNRADNFEVKRDECTFESLAAVREAIYGKPLQGEHAAPVVIEPIPGPIITNTFDRVVYVEVAGRAYKLPPGVQLIEKDGVATVHNPK